MSFNAAILSGPFAQKWDKHKFDLKLVNPANKRKFDLIVGRIPQRFALEDLNVEVLFEEPMFVTAGVDNRFAKRKRVELAELVDEPWVLPQSDSAIGSFVAESFRHDLLRTGWSE